MKRSLPTVFRERKIRNTPLVLPFLERSSIRFEKLFLKWNKNFSIYPRHCNEFSIIFSVVLKIPVIFWLFYSESDIFHLGNTFSCHPLLDVKKSGDPPQATLLNEPFQVKGRPRRDYHVSSGHRLRTPITTPSDLAPSTTTLAIRFLRFRSSFSLLRLAGLQPRTSMA